MVPKNGYSSVKLYRQHTSPAKREAATHGSLVNEHLDRSLAVFRPAKCHEQSSSKQAYCRITCAEGRDLFSDGVYQVAEHGSIVSKHTDKLPSASQHPQWSEELRSNVWWNA